jgi:hypothetical protein
MAAQSVEVVDVGPRACCGRNHRERRRQSCRSRIERSVERLVHLYREDLVEVTF